MTIQPSTTTAAYDYGAPAGLFTGKERDQGPMEWRNDYFGARYMSAAQGRFTSPDTPFADQFVENPQSWNLYSYTRNNPLKYVDVDGNAALAATGRWIELQGAQLPGVFGRAAVLAGTTLITADVAWENRDSIRRNVGEVVEQWGRANEFGPEAPRPYMSENSQAQTQGAPTRQSSDGNPSSPFDPNDKKNLDLMKRGRAPKDGDGKPVELHHKDQKPEGPLLEMTQKEHRGAGNYNRNHPQGNRHPSRINRNEANRQREEY